MKKSKKETKKRAKSDLKPKRDAKGGWAVIAGLASGIGSASSGGSGGASIGEMTITKKVDSSSP